MRRISLAHACTGESICGGRTGATMMTASGCRLCEADLRRCPILGNGDPERYRDLRRHFASLRSQTVNIDDS